MVWLTSDMAGIDLRFEVTDMLSPALDRLQAATSDFSQSMAKIAGEMAIHTLDRFDHEYGPDALPWRPSQRVIAKGGRTLFERGDLRNAIDPNSGSDFAEVGILAAGGPAIYARVHQNGAVIRPRQARALRTPAGPRASVTIPARPFIGIEARDRTVAEDVLIRYLESAWRGDDGSGRPVGAS